MSETLHQAGNGNTTDIEVPWPDLPPISDAALQRLSLTHKSIGSIASKEGYEMLAHVGDAILLAVNVEEFFITCLLRDLFPKANKGDITELRSRLVDREMNCQIAEHYELPSNVKAGKGVSETLQDSIRQKGELWEAYLGALFYSYVKKFDRQETETTMNIASLSIGGHSSVTSPTDNHHYSHIQFHGRAFDSLVPFLEAPYIPFARNVVDPGMKHQKDLLDIASRSKSKAELQEMKQKEQIRELVDNKGKENGKPTLVKDEDGNGGKDKFKATCEVTMNDGIILFGEGFGRNYKDAETIAAYMVHVEYKKRTHSVSLSKKMTHKRR
ncbi:hypothetical protein I203_105365 [Kwoniella mangroviensis CBS 8507]|uniref:uncharacterized protein n=1 Tax=Kwoniella mangroviensis CBS 8507 TaxID=1296122 RepID=UPI00080D42B3|nr:uncharacterized protein I203_01182 [Kwoniella mangroviensis CBS 8507]OCF69325.1 hypothetical protein I203_01182 [Kwoniella mangroviensis CBS 8507]